MVRKNSVGSSTFAAGEESEREYEARREAAREIDPNEDEDFRPEED